jgi:hypothetical protein
VAEWLTDAFLDAVKRRGNISTSPDGWSDSDLLAIATDEMRDSIVPMLRRLNEEFLIHDYDVSVSAGTDSYPLPSWALAEGLRDVQVADGNGGYVPLLRREPQDAVSSGLQIKTACYYLKDDAVVLVPTPSAASGLRMRCLRRPSRLVTVENGIAVTAVASTYVEVDSVALDGVTTRAEWVTANASIGAELTAGTPGFRYNTEAAPVLVFTGPSSNRLAMTFSRTPSVGDIVTPLGTSVVPQIPADLFALLAQATVCGFLRGSGQPGLDTAEQKRAAMEAEAVSLFSPRTQNQPRYLKNKYGARTGYRRP